MIKIVFFLIIALFSFSSFARRGEVILDAKYGTHERQAFDLWLPKSLKKTPLVVYIHGGGFVMGSKDEFRENNIINKYLNAGIAFA